MKPKILGALFTGACLATISSAYAQTPTGGTADAVQKQKLLDAAQSGQKLPTNVTVHGNVEVQAVLLPPKLCYKLFGKEVGQSYAAIELIVSNKSQDSALILHSVFLDYSQWLMSGSEVAMRRWMPGTATASQTQNSTSQLKDTQAEIEEYQVAGAEYRIVRGQALAYQPWTLRNVSMRVLEFLGAIATGSEFAFKEQGITKGIGVFTGQLVPGAKVLIPDGTIDELNRISDFGFRANMTIPKASSDILVGFFPVERFLSPGLKKIFLNSPSVFFVPGEGLVDPVVKDGLLSVFKAFLPADAGKSLDLQSILSNPKAWLPIQGLSLNNIHVVVSGSMTVDPDTIPARVDSIACDPNDGDKWKKGTTVNCVIQGTLLAGGQPAIDENIAPTITSDTSTSTATQTHFSMTLAADQTACTALHVHVAKTKNNNTIDSNKLAFTVPGSGGAACPAR